MFIWNQIAYAAGDLFIIKPTPAASFPEETLQKSAIEQEVLEQEAIEQETFEQEPALEQEAAQEAESAEEETPAAEEELEIKNYVSDLFSYKKKQSAAHKLLPSAREQGQNSKLPVWRKSTEQRSEEHIRNLQATDELIETLYNRRKPRDEVELPLNKKKSSGGGVGQDPYDYSATEPDQNRTPHNLNDLVNPRDLTQINKYDITMMNIDQWMEGAVEEQGDDGVSYWLGRGDDNPDEARLIMRIVYAGSGNSKKIEAIYLGFRLTEGGEYEAKYKIEYTYKNGGSDIDKTEKFDISDGGRRLIERSIYELSGEDNRIKTTIYYGTTGAIINRRDYLYNADGALREARLYETDSETEGELIHRTVFVLERNQELADYSQSYYDGEVTETTVYYYQYGLRAGDSAENYRYSKSKQITFRGNPETDGVEGLSDDELNNARKISMLVYDDENRLAGEEVADYMVLYADGNIAVKTTVYFYKDGKRAKDANYRECLTSAVTYYGNLDQDKEGEEGYGEISEDELAAGIKESETFYDTLYRLKGEEVQDYSVTYLMDGKTRKDTTVYIFEGDKRASESDSEDRMKKSVTYWGDAVNANGTIKEDAKKKAETFYQFKTSAKHGEEVADVTLSYYQDGETVRDTTFYFYNGNLRASEATNRTGLERSATFWGDALLEVDLLNLDGSGNYDLGKLAEFIAIKLGINLGTLGSGDDALSAILALIAGDNPSLISALESLSALNLSVLTDQEDLVSALLSLAGDNLALMELLLSVEITDGMTKEELIIEILTEAGMSAEEAALSAILLMMDLSAYASTAEFLKAFISEARANAIDLSAEILSLLLDSLLSEEDQSLTEGLLFLLESMAADESNLKAFLGSLTLADLDALEIDTLAELIDYLKANALAEGYT
ncbi:MAG: hypothetical protein HQ549_05910, partial [Candidatus Omnitrophica bacterium]|nr:hypothetical protein [Candidatus Omnitrophota bacterium]